MKYRWPLLAAFLAVPTAVSAHGIHAGDGTIAEASFTEFLGIGTKHMLVGYDHLLFVLGIVLLIRGFKEVVKYITAFTVGHSITLLLASLAGISVNYLLIDALIGLSVAYIGLENVYGKRIRDARKRKKQWSPDPKLIIYIFGLLHGLGLATRLQGLGLPEEGSVKAILGFNVGVEIGQLAALSMFLLVGLWLRRFKNYRTIQTVLGSLLMVSGFGIYLVMLGRALS